MRLAVLVVSGRNDPEALAFQRRERLAAEVEDDVADVGVGAFRGQAVIALHRRLGGLARRVEIDAGLRGACRRLRFAAGALVRLRQQRGDALIEGLGRGSGAVRERRLRRQFRPTVLLGERVRRRDDAPARRSNRSGTPGCRPCKNCSFRLHHDIGSVVFDRADRASRLAGVAADADLGIDQVLLDGLVHGALSELREARRLPSGVRPCAAAHIRNRRACCRCRLWAAAIQLAYLPAS